jgi:cytochrome c553
MQTFIEGKVGIWATVSALLLGLLLAGMPVHADEKSNSVTLQILKDIKEGKLKPAEGDSSYVQELVIKRGLPIRYSDIKVLMQTPNAFGSGAACVTCHSSQDPAKSYRGLDLSTCKGMLDGSMEEPRRALFQPGTDPKRDVLIRRLRNNRMPLGTPFFMPNDTEAYKAVNTWITDGANNDEFFKKNVLRLFKTKNAFGPNTPACTSCHMSNREPPSFHELDLGSYKGIMLGADSIAKGVDKATKVIIPGKPSESGVWQHLVEDRMPPGISPAENRDHPSTAILSLWIKQGAKCD